MPAENLSQEEARLRGELVGETSYQVTLDLTTAQKTFLSVTRVEFEAAPGSETFLDLIAESVQEVSCNGALMDLSCWHDSRIHLSDLAAHNVVEVRATCRYSHTGEGLHRFVDPADGEAYVYSQFEVADSRRVFAVFEQPDIKATYQFSITAPAHWKMFTNSPSPAAIPISPSAATWSFPPTARMSSYIAAIVGGPYAGITGQLTSADGRTIPLGVYCRASMSEYLDGEEIIKLTQAGFKFYEAAFDYPYPFDKYDQVFVPEFNAGAMENAGLVTYRDSYVFRSKPVAATVERRCVTILHELAHMWFGDLVTMKWWNDLWLNESFAEFMSTLATAEATEWTNAWTTFASLEKAWAYRQDQLSSTHPIVAQINDLEDVEVNFDGITYAKGASVLRQLVAYVGREEFFAGVQNYFKTHAWGNTVLTDFLAELEATSGRDLTTWSQRWLEESGITVLRPEITSDENGIITTAALTQELGNAPRLRPHRLIVGGYYLNKESGELERRLRVELDIDGLHTPVNELVGQARPDIVLLNDEDLTYAKLRLDADSLRFATTHLSAFTDPLARSLVLSTAWDMARDGEMAASDYIDLVLSALPIETESTGLLILLRNLDTAVDLYSSTCRRPDLQAHVSTRLLRLAQVAQAGSDAQLQLVKAAARRAFSGEERQAILDLFTGVSSLHGLSIDTDLRWDLAQSGEYVYRSGLQKSVQSLDGCKARAFLCLFAAM